MSNQNPTDNTTDTPSTDVEVSIPVYTLYGFLVDDALRPQVRVETNYETMQTHGNLDSEVGNYLVNRTNIVDNRYGRLPIINTTSGFGHMSIACSSDIFNAPDIFQHISDIEQTLFFNILERIYLRQGISDDSLEMFLISDSIYHGYVPNTCVCSTQTESIKVYNSDKAHFTVTMNDWISFEFKTEFTHIKAHIWISAASFGENYPFTSILNVITPYAPEALTDPIALLQTGALDVLTTSSSVVFDQAHIESTLRDQTGIYTYYTKYILTADKNVQLPFALPYSGSKEPTSLACRKAIREHLEANVSITPDDLAKLFPELYINARFFVAPLWDKYTSMSHRDIYNSIINLTDILQRRNIIFKNSPIAFLDEYTEVILNPQNTIFSISLPDELNHEIFSILGEHPTMQNYSIHSTGFRYMEGSTQEFVTKLSQCMAVADGSVDNIYDFILTDIEEFQYLTFVAGNAEYLLMTKESYLAAIQAYGVVGL